MMEFQPNSQPIFMQIAERICDQIVQGAFADPQGRIPSVREYAAEVEVNVNTVMRSYEWLARQGLIYNRRGIGYFVADDAAPSVLAMRYRRFINGEMEQTFSRLSQLGITPDALRDMYAEFLNQSSDLQK